MNIMASHNFISYINDYTRVTVIPNLIYITCLPKILRMIIQNPSSYSKLLTTLSQ